MVARSRALLIEGAMLLVKHPASPQPRFALECTENAAVMQ